MFEPKQVAGKKILLVRDCGVIKGELCISNGSDPRYREYQCGAIFSEKQKELCETYMKHFSRGDAKILENILNRVAFDEIWLYSGGGNLDEGIAIGELFQRLQVTVRVPDKAYCVSACTIAFLGGFFRFIDEGASYEVHSLF